MNPDDEPKMNVELPENTDFSSGMRDGNTMHFEPDPLGGIVFKDSGGTPVLKLNQNAFIAAFTKAFAASSNQVSGSFGSDWFQFFCELDSDGSAEVAGVIELPSTDRMLIKRSGSGAILRIVSVAGGAGYIDLFEPLILRTLSSDPASPQQGMIYFNTSSNKIKVYSGSGWETVTSS